MKIVYQASWYNRGSDFHYIQIVKHQPLVRQKLAFTRDSLWKLQPLIIFLWWKCNPKLDLIQCQVFLFLTETAPVLSFLETKLVICYISDCARQKGVNPSACLLEISSIRKSLSDSLSYVVANIHLLVRCCVLFARLRY